MAAHLHWRILFDKGPGSTVDLREVGFFDAQGEDLSVGGVGSASSEYGGSYLKAYLFDKNLNTYYATASGVAYPQWVGYSFLSAVDVRKVRVYPTSSTYAPANVRLQFSDDGSVWSTPQSLIEASGGLAQGLDTMLTLPIVFDGPLLATGMQSWMFRSIPGPLLAVANGRQQLAVDLQFGGSGRIWGTTKIKGAAGTPDAPAKSRVVLLHQRSKLPVREVWSDPITGAFVFEGIDTTQQFLTLAEDAAGNFRPVAASRLAPEVAP